MNSISRRYNKYCGKENRIEEEKCPIIIKCGCPNSSQIITTFAELTSTATIAAVTIDKSCLCNPITKLEFTTNISTVDRGFAGTVSFRVFRQCQNEFVPVAVGPTWSSVITAADTIIVSFFICDSDSCENDCCTYTVVATATAAVATSAGSVLFNNATLGAIATCKSNRCNECKKDSY